LINQFHRDVMRATAGDGDAVALPVRAACGWRCAVAADKSTVVVAVMRERWR